jgi:hypothetical protein
LVAQTHFDALHGILESLLELDHERLVELELHFIEVEIEIEIEIFDPLDPRTGLIDTLAGTFELDPRSYPGL